MSRVGLVNMVIGFGVLFFAAASGSFIAFDLTEGYLRDNTLLDSWQSVLMQSSHGHTNLFASIHILMGLTLPYTRLPFSWQWVQTFCFFCGTMAMGPGMMARAYAGPTDTLDPTGILVGVGLSLALLALLSHFAALSFRLVRTP
ncbi:hypothetical protein [Pseudobacteriovorax antillogorgiicola]|uniref:Uncharacterized protein n=1 Tax=Pseudobacteriovorax antillogorgiicola TaxID=1513793 RepID=A0A1Y6CSD1_9BACT|nr:hypothetical protein [Pseudobacteriovorax antillogorgiicola]TCS45652.1 hypothetical protein EDD56_12745 [Pseudobacteriovorax antillogorgiicola]SMF72915.1 hypothetical protein SAMN06296036_12744 [Pseudobacteriovorax antillogorgiicola]